MTHPPPWGLSGWRPPFSLEARASENPLAHTHPFAPLQTKTSSRRLQPPPMGTPQPWGVLEGEHMHFKGRGRLGSAPDLGGAAPLRPFSATGVGGGRSGSRARTPGRGEGRGGGGGSSSETQRDVLQPGLHGDAGGGRAPQIPHLQPDGRTIERLTWAGAAGTTRRGVSAPCRGRLPGPGGLRAPLPRAGVQALPRGLDGRPDPEASRWCGPLARFGFSARLHKRREGWTDGGMPGTSGRSRLRLRGLEACSCKDQSLGGGPPKSLRGSAAS